jgi:CheY-like chemotaxis protein
MSKTTEIANIHLLLVEDNPRYLDELLEWLHDFGYRQLETARSVVEAREKLTQPFDVIIADMRMEKDDSGFEVMEEVEQLNLTSVVIILTANDTVLDCRRAFKQKAWDYISKNMPGYNVFEVLHESIQEAITSFDRWGNIHNEQWIADNEAWLAADYAGQVIAVMNKNVIAAATTREKLDQRLDALNLRRYMLTIKQIGTPTSIADLIGKPESATLEFKSTLQWNVREQQKDVSLRFNVLKTIAAFLNSNGGTLVIGVEDNGNIFGLEHDLALFSEGKRTLDTFERNLMEAVHNSMGAAVTQHLRIAFETIEGKSVCIVTVQKMATPVFLKEGKGTGFYIRTGNATNFLHTAQEVVAYIQQRSGEGG